VKYLWLFWLPLLYLPSLAVRNNTGFGNLQLSDFLIGPYIILVYLRVKDSWIQRLEPGTKLYIHRLIPIFALFIWWAFISTFTISMRYEYTSSYYVNFGVLKIAKWVLYVFAVILTTSALSKASSKEYQGFLWSFLVCGLFVGVGLVVTGNGNASGFTDGSVSSDRLFEDNGINVLLSMVIVFLVGMLVRGNGNKLWRRATALGLVIIILGFVSARGRGGWIAALVALIYIGANINIQQTMRATVVGLMIFTFAFTNNTTFQVEVMKTVSPEDTGEYYKDIYGEVDLGVDDGGRLGIFIYQLRRVIDDPIVGRGIFHRGGSSGTYVTGSHNFFLQMFLETGIPGGLVMIVIFKTMWNHASSEDAKKRNIALPVQAAIIAAAVSGMTETYFYGGMELFTFLIIYGIVGSMPAPDNP